MRRKISKLIALGLVFYLFVQSFVLFRGYMRTTMPLTSTRSRDSVTNQSEEISTTTHHHKFVVKPLPVLGNAIKLGSGEPYINVDLSKVGNFTRKSKIYSSFDLRLPHFIDNQSSTVFLRKKDNLVDGLIRTPAQLYGELYILRNGTYDTSKDCGYMSVNTWVHTDRRVPAGNWYDILAPVIVPDGNTFQHFLDGTLPKLVQALPVLKNRKVKILMRHLRDNIILEIFDRLNISRDQLVFSAGGVIGANMLIYPCITPPIHPQLWQEARRLITRGSTIPKPVNESLIIFITRQGCHNCGRSVLNQAKVIEMLNKRYGSDKVREFRGPEGLDHAVKLFSNARIVMGSHGGGMYNINFAPTNTTVIEFMPTKDNGDVVAAAHQIIWHMSQMLDQDYWRICIPPSGKGDMSVDLKLLSDLLDVVDKKQGT